MYIQQLFDKIGRHDGSPKTYVVWGTWCRYCPLCMHLGAPGESKRLQETPVVSRRGLKSRSLHTSDKRKGVGLKG